MAEANSLEEDKAHHLHGLRPVMPHLEHPGRKVMDTLYPPIVAAEDLEDKVRLNNDEDDVVFQHGLEIVEGICQKLITDGRRRVE